MTLSTKTSATNYGLSDQVRSVALKKYIQPAARAGRTRVAIAVRDLMNDLRPLGFPERNWHQICSAIQAHKFLRESGAEIESIEGPASKTSSTVVVHYLIGADAALVAKSPEDEKKTASADETPEEWAHRVTGKIRGLLKEELAEYGGAEGFIRWVRGYDEEEK